LQWKRRSKKEKKNRDTIQVNSYEFAFGNKKKKKKKEENQISISAGESGKEALSELLAIRSPRLVSFSVAKNDPLAMLRNSHNDSLVMRREFQRS